MRLDATQILTINQIDRFQEKVHAAAVMYAEQGLYVIPVRPKLKSIPSKLSGDNSYDIASNDPKTVSDWYAEGGKYRGWNIGLACGSMDGIVVVDVDVKDKKGNSGIESLRELEDKYGPLAGNCPVQRTPKGGMHFIFKSNGLVPPSSGKLGKGIDTRGGDGRNRSHIVAWPSVTSDGEYQWEEMGEIPDIPEWVLELMGRPWERATITPAGPGRGNENVDEDDEERKMTLSQIAKVLQGIKIDELEYEDWLKIGMAIHSQHPDESGLRLWDSWSESGARYKYGECHARWFGFAPDGTTRIGTLLHIAREYGYVSEPEIIKDGFEPRRRSDIEVLIDELNEKYAVAVIGGKTKVINMELSEDPEDDISIMGLDDFKSFTMNKKIVITGPDGKPKVIPKTQLWLSDERRREFPRGLVFEPNAPREHNGAYNMWRGWAVSPRPGDWSKLKRHLLEVVCSGDQFHYEWILDWMADLFQDPGNPKGTAIVMRGPEGAGKGTFIEAMGRTMGRHYKHLVEEKHLTGQFNGHLADGLLVFADEVVYGGCRKTAGKLKAMVTERNLMIERKGIDVVSYRNCARLAIASNEDWFIPAGPSSRRWFVLDVNGSHASDKKWFDAIYDEMDRGGVEAMVHELMGRKITNNLTKAPETKVLQDQRAMYASNNPLYEWLISCVERGDMGVMDMESDDLNTKWPSMVTKFNVYETFEAWCLLRRKTPTSKPAFYSKLAVLGFGNARPQAKDGGTRPHCFRVPKIVDLIKSIKSVGGIDFNEGDDNE